jgi:uncharacterized membrane protein YgaE (UPF0421/DUF939 family)
MSEKNTSTHENEMSSGLIWEARIRWFLGIGALVVVNFASVSYYAGSYTKDIEANKAKISTLENNTINKDQFNELKNDLKDIQKDIKDLIKDGRKK